MKNMSFGTKLLLILVSTVILSLGIMIFFISSNTYKNSSLQAESYVKALVEKYGEETKAKLDLSISSTEAIANRLETAIKNGEKLTKSGMVDFQKEILNKNPILFANWIVFEDDSYLFSRNDGTDTNNYYTKDGKNSFAPYIIKEKNGFLTAAIPKFTKERELINIVYEKNRVAVTPPYMDSAKNILVISISAPIHADGKIIGVAGVDIELAVLANEVSKQKIYENGYLNLIDSHNIVTSHKSADRIGKDYKELAKGDTNRLQILDNQKAGKSHEFYAKATSGGAASFLYSYPFEFGNTGQYWVVLGVADESEFLASVKENIIFSLILAAFITFIIVAILIFSMRKLSNNLKTISAGLLSFFAFLNKESKTTNDIIIDSSDEFGIMAKVINENIQKTKAGIEEDRRLIDETISVLGEFEQGDLCQRLNTKVSNPALMQLSTVINGMGDVLEKNIENILDVLEKYSSYNYLSKVSTNGLKEQLLALANGVNGLGDSITSMLKENKSNGLTLDESSMILLANVDKLNISSNEAAASLEETAAALEEITSNIRNNTENIAKMAKYSNEITKASSDGEKLANSTTTAMDEINTQVNLVNDAISVIDQIAFQTNILSLNAAVEAATAGEAGKGFAVVAQEVRNLANRSAEAAKEIKDIVEGATLKANEGKDIASTMIEGYKGLNNSIEQTINLISDVEMSSKEQLLGIEQINDAVNQLDQQTQQNAMIASQTHDIAVGTDEIAKLIVQDANQKEFESKNEVKAKDVGIKKEVKEHIIASTPKKVVKPNTTSTINKANTTSPKEIKDSSNSDEWESF